MAGCRVIKPELLDSLAEEQARASLADMVRTIAEWGGTAARRSMADRRYTESKPKCEAGARSFLAP